jgi:hypothetical protein
VYQEGVFATFPLNLFSRFSYYIAGSGGVGPTTLASSFLLLGEDAVAYNKGTFDFLSALVFFSVEEYLRS